jgi:signal transduction histidine kinase
MLATAVVPLWAGGRVLGTLAVDFAEVIDLDQEKRDVLELFAAHAAAALERAQLIHAAIEQTRREEAERRVQAEAAAALHARGELLSIAAHELRTPLAALRGYVQLLVRRLQRGRAGPEEIADALRVVEQQSEKLARLMARVLDDSRMEAGQLALDWSEADLTALVEGVARSAAPTSEQHTVVVRTPGQPVPARIDPLRLEQVLVNLVENALKYSPDGGEVAVRLEVPEVPDHFSPGGSPPDGSGPRPIQIVVRDHGIGVAPEHRAHIFERFYRAAGAEHAAGAGLGLFICRQTVELHGGTIAAEFPADGGTRMVVTLPARLLIESAAADGAPVPKREPSSAC